MTPNQHFFLSLQAKAHLRDVPLLIKALKTEHDLSELAKCSLSQLQSYHFSDDFIQALKNPDKALIEKHLNWLACDKQHHYIELTHPLYPDLLKQIPTPPVGLFIKGDPSLLQSFQIALVGSRKATPTGLEFAKHLAQTLHHHGLVITSGLALGIDGAAHRGTLSSRKATLAVTGSGLNNIYPRAHLALSEDILSQEGAIISEYPLDTPALKINFPRRNRLIAGLSLGVCVIEAAIRSGSLITANLALKYHREVFAVPGSPLNQFAQGCNRLIQSGAKLITNADEIICELPFLMQTNIASCEQARNNKDKNMFSDQKSNIVLESVGFEATSVEKILNRSGLTVSEVTATLSTLELAGQIITVPGGFIRAH
jgi:DNA processing protein